MHYPLPGRCGANPDFWPPTLPPMSSHAHMYAYEDSIQGDFAPAPSFRSVMEPNSSAFSHASNSIYSAQCEPDTIPSPQKCIRQTDSRTCGQSKYAPSQSDVHSSLKVNKCLLKDVVRRNTEDTDYSHLFHLLEKWIDGYNGPLHLEQRGQETTVPECILFDLYDNKKTLIDALGELTTHAQQMDEKMPATPRPEFVPSENGFMAELPALMSASEFFHDKTFEELYNWAASEGFCISIFSSRQNSAKNKTQTFTIKCFHTHAPASKARQAKSKLIGNSGRIVHKMTSEKHSCHWQVKFTRAEALPMKGRQFRSCAGDRWKVTGTFHHNHERVSSMAVYSSYRRHNLRKYKDGIEALLGLNMQPNAIIRTLQAIHRKPIPITNIDISNFRYRRCQIKLMGETDAHQHLEAMKNQTTWEFDYSLDDNKRLSRYFLSHVNSKHYFQRHNAVLFMDGTFATNKYGMTLVNIVGMAPDRTTFNVGYCLLTKTTKEDYIWMLRNLVRLYADNGSLLKAPKTILTDHEMSLINAIEEVFPRTVHLTCEWHLRQNISKYIISHRKDILTEYTIQLNNLSATYANQLALYHHFVQCVQSGIAACPVDHPGEEPELLGADFLQVVNDRFKGLIHAHSKEQFCTRWENLRRLLGEKNPAILYFDKVWMVCKEKWGYAWTRDCVTWGHTATSRVESSHAALKIDMATNVQTISQLVKQLADVTDNQLSNLAIRLSRYKMLKSDEASGSSDENFQLRCRPIYRDLWGFIAPEIIKLVHKDLEKAVTDSNSGLSSGICHGRHTKHTGRPCRHLLLECWHTSAMSLSVSDFDRQWHLKDGVVSREHIGNPYNMRMHVGGKYTAPMGAQRGWYHKMIDTRKKAPVQAPRGPNQRQPKRHTRHLHGHHHAAFSHASQYSGYQIPSNQPCMGSITPPYPGSSLQQPSAMPCPTEQPPMASPVVLDQPQPFFLPSARSVVRTPPGLSFSPPPVPVNYFTQEYSTIRQ